MNVISHGDSACEKIRKYLDSYISNELMVETNHEVLRHLESCQPCAAELDSRSRLRTRLKAAVNAQRVPPELQVRIRSKIRNSGAGNWASFGWLPGGWPRWAGAMAAVVVCAGLWMNYSTERLP